MHAGNDVGAQFWLYVTITAFVLLMLVLSAYAATVIPHSTSHLEGGRRQLSTLNWQRSNAFILHIRYAFARFSRLSLGHRFVAFSSRLHWAKMMLEQQYFSREIACTIFRMQYMVTEYHRKKNTDCEWASHPLFIFKSIYKRLINRFHFSFENRFFFVLLKHGKKWSIGERQNHPWHKTIPETQNITVFGLWFKNKRNSIHCCEKLHTATFLCTKIHSIINFKLFYFLNKKHFFFRDSETFESVQFVRFLASARWWHRWRGALQVCSIQWIIFTYRSRWRSRSSPTIDMSAIKQSSNWKKYICLLKQLINVCICLITHHSI